MVPLPLLPAMTQVMPGMMAALFMMGMKRKTFFPWLEEEDDHSKSKETLALKETIRQKERKISQLEQETAELKRIKTMPQLRNVIFKTTFIDPETHRERELQMESLHRWIGEHFVSRVTAKYEWFALWRVLYDKKLIEGSRAMTSKFANQMNDWYPEAEHRCDEGAVNRFRSGYLGQTPFSLWNENAYLSKLSGKQSYSAFRHLYGLCEDLNNTLKTGDFYK